MQFSIIIPLYNKVVYVEHTLQSVAAQTCTDWECIIVDDGSTDGSAQLADRWAHEHCGYKVLHQSNAGVAVARNAGVAIAQGLYLCFLDADDWWKPEFLAEQQKMINAYPDAGLWATNYIYYKPGKTHVALDIPTGYFNYPRAYVHGVAMPIFTGTVCMPRCVFDECKGFPVGVRLGEDFLLWAKVAMRYPVAFCNTPLTYYNNDVPTTLRATRHIYPPSQHMLFLLHTIAEEQTLSADWKSLWDMLRVNGLMDYLMNADYHDAACAELAKVDWSKQTLEVRRRYKMPIYLLYLHRTIMHIGSLCKQWIIRKTMK